MDELIRYTELFDYYGCLLTEKQQEYFTDYFFNNLTLSEMAENNNISRNAIHKQIKIVEEKLNDYESKLCLLEKAKQIKKIVEQINDERINKIIDLL